MFAKLSVNCDQPCFCLCLGFSQITITLPFLLMILHLSQIFLTDGLTFIVIIPYLSCFGVCSHVRVTSVDLSKRYALRKRSFCSPGDTSLVEVVNRNLNRNAVTGKNSDIVHTKLTRNTSRNDVLVGKLYLEGRVRQSLNNNAFKFNCVLRQNNPSVSLSENFCRRVRTYRPQAS